MHDQNYQLESPWAQHLEGSYFPIDILRCSEQCTSPLLYLDNYSRELIWSTHDNTRVVRWVLRECGVTLAGPVPAALLDPLPVSELHAEVLETMREWAGEILAGKYPIDNRWAQPFAVLSYCRMLHILACGRVESKLAGVRWAIGALDPGWVDLIQGAWKERPDPTWKCRQPADALDIQRTQAFIRYALEVAATDRR